MDAARREILEQVANGALSPEEAASRLAGLKEPSAEESPVRTVEVLSQGGRVEVVGDQTVREAVADGRHVARRVGDRLVFEAEPEFLLDFGAFVFSQGRTGPRFETDRGLVIRMNPHLALDAEVQAGSLQTLGIRGPIRAVLEAGSATLSDFAGPLDVTLKAGSLRGTGVLNHGSSRIQSQMGSVRLHLARGSSVRLRARSSLGSVQLLEGHSGSEATLGTGEASLDIESAMGSVRVTAER
jgi:hypothetical protein